MSFLLSTGAFIFVFSVSVLIHEWGHFFVARKNGIKVEEFGFGLPPRIWGFKKGETLYSVNAIPFGGFVRLFGEDSSDSKVKKNPRSFSNKPVRVRIMVVIAGVVMNFLLAFFLLTIGFIVGIEPLILNFDELLARMNDGTIKSEQGLIVQEVKKGSPAEISGLQANDKVLTVDGREIFSLDYVNEIIKGKSEMKTPVVLSVDRKGQKKDVQITAAPNQNLGFSFYESVFLPRLQIQNLPTENVYYKAGSRAGDVILQINNKNIFTFDDFQQALQGSRSIKLNILRDMKPVHFELTLPQTDYIIVSAIFPGSPAEKAGFQIQDSIVQVDGNSFLLPKDLINYTNKMAGKTLTYTLRNSGVLREVKVEPDKDGLIGIGLSILHSYENQQLSVFNRNMPLSIREIQPVRYPFWIAPLKAFEESGRLSVLTVQGFGNVLYSLATQLRVPEDVSGPVGIAQMTSTVVQKGIWSFLRFMALLSLTLAIMNVLPLPALDGGRLFFILIEVIIGRPVKARYESLVHAVGFIALLLLIGIITFHDILKFF